MNLQALIDTIFEDLDARVNSVAFDAQGDLLLKIAYDDVVLPDGGKRCVELKCVRPKEFTVVPGFIGTIAQFDEHALLANHRGPQSQLFFSSAPGSPEQVFYLSHAVLRSQFGGWRDPATYLNGTPDELRTNLAAGYGLLARGPCAAMAALAAALGSLLSVRTIDSHELYSTVMALTFDEQFVVCESAEVLQGDGQSAAGADDT